jgi:predicted transcriptional regulator
MSKREVWVGFDEDGEPCAVSATKEATFCMVDKNCTIERYVAAALATAEQTAFAAETAAVSPLRQVELAQARELERINAFIREMAKKCGYRPLNADQLSPEEDLAQSIAMLDRNLTQEIAEHQRHHDAEAAAGRASGGEWVAVTERLPDVGKLVLVVESGWAEAAIGCLHEDGVWNAEDDADSPLAVTHWMPLPSPPEKPTEGGGR